MNELIIRIVTEQDTEELDTNIRNALFGIADISSIEVVEFNHETKGCNYEERKSKEKIRRD